MLAVRLSIAQLEGFVSSVDSDPIEHFDLRLADVTVLGSPPSFPTPPLHVSEVRYTAEQLEPAFENTTPSTVLIL